MPLRCAVGREQTSWVTTVSLAEAGGGKVSSKRTALEVVQEFLRYDGRMDADAQAKLLSDDYVDEMIGREPMRGKVEITAESKRYFAAFPDYHREYLHLLPSGDFVTAHWRMTGTNTGSLTPELPATGKTIDLPGCTLFEVRDGLIVHAWLYTDRMTMFRQLGVI